MGLQYAVWLLKMIKELNVNDCTEWLIKWFGERGSLPDNFSEQNYFDLGLIDSFEVLELIDDVEGEFGIAFTDLHFQDRRFVTVSGLSEIIYELKEGKNNNG